MNHNSEEINEEVEERLTSKGQKNIEIALVLFFVAVIIAFIMVLFKPANWRFIAKLFLPALFFLAVGFRQIYIKSDKDIREVNIEMYGVEEPDKLWACPKCNNENQNITYTCTACGYSLK